MSSITYAQRLYEFPLGVFGISIATAVFPLLAKQNNDAVAFAATIRTGAFDPGTTHHAEAAALLRQAARLRSAISAPRVLGKG
jgi:peptidoglycan biosynthesis protein MviN/MurJ (putative lipid II flippase)